MNNQKFFFAVLCLCLACCLAGCQLGSLDPTVEPTASTTMPTVTQPTETTAPAPDLAQMYLDGISALGTQAVAMDIHGKQTMTLAGQTFTLDINETVAYWNLNTEDFISVVTQTRDFGKHSVTFSETFHHGYVYQQLNYQYFKSAMSAEDVLLRYPGLQLLDPSLYELSMDGENTILFRNPTGLEKWIVDEEGELIQAQATVTLSDEGTVTGCVYHVEYIYGPATYCDEYTVIYTDPGSLPVLPENVDRYKELDSIDGMWLLDSAYGYILQAKQYSTSKSWSIQSQIAGCVLSTSYDMHVMPSLEGTSDYRVLTNVYLMDPSGELERTNDERFIMGQYSYAMDDDRPAYNDAVTEVIMNNFCQNLLIEDIYEPEMLENAVITDLGSLLLVEYTCSEKMGQNFCDAVCTTLFGSADFLDDYVSGYETKQISYYLSLDKYTLLPVALGTYFEGAHFYQGEELLLIEQVTQRFDLATLTAYEEIHDQPSPDAEPEEMPTPLFYRVTGADGQQMWLFGTIHVGDNRTGYLPKEIYAALDNSAALVLECDTDGFEEQLKDDKKLQEKVSDCYYYEDGTAGDYLVTEGLYEYAVKVMKATGNYNHNAEYLKTAMWSSSIDNFYLSQGHQLSSEKGVESRLITYAQDNDIPLWEAESSLFQLQMLTGYSDELQEFQLYSSAYGHGKSSWEGSLELYEMWLAGDEEALIKELERTPWGWTEEDFADMETYSEEEKERAQYLLDNLETINAQVQQLQAEYVKAMETDRNAGMLEKAVEYLESGETVFFAVGLAHLLAEDGLVSGLRDAGYTVELITYANPS